MFEIIKEPRGDVYKNLVRFALQKSDAIMFVIRKDYYIKPWRKQIIENITKMLNISIEDLEKDYKKIIDDNYEQIYINRYKILNKYMEKFGEMYDKVYEKEEVYTELKEDIKRQIKFEIELKDDPTYQIQEKEMNKLKEKLKDSLIKERHNPEWVGTKVFCKKEDYEYKGTYLYDICFYKICPVVEEFLLNSTSSLYGFMPPYLPQDIAFFYKGHAWFYTIAHEKIGVIETKNNEEIKFLKQIGLKLSKYYDSCLTQQEITELLDERYIL